VKYPAPGDPDLARRVKKWLAPLSVELEENWGLDQGTWSVLRHVYPQADVPVVQLSIDENQPSSFHCEIGKRLVPLREEGVLIVGSGNLVHNLHAHAWGKHTVQPYDWAVRFERNAKELLLAADDLVPLSTMRTLVATHCCRFQPQTTICRSCMSWVHGLAESASASRSRG